MMPNFLLIGAMKAGTTSMYHHLKAHPDVFMCPTKEPTYFALGEVAPEAVPGRWVATRAEYEALFSGAAGALAIGEASTMYLASPSAAAKIRSEIPDARLIAVLRNPCDRAFSAYAMYRSQDAEPIARFEDAVREELAGRNPRHYVGSGRYAEALRRYYDLFDPSQLLIFLYEDLSGDPLATLRAIYEFIGVDPSFEPDVARRYNVGAGREDPGRFASRSVQARVRAAARRVRSASIRGRTQPGRAGASRTPEPMSPETRRWLLEQFADDLDRLEPLIGRDLSAWREA